MTRYRNILGRGQRRGGFTLIEAALTTVIIGVGVVAMIELLARGTVVNSAATRLTTGLNLANNVREICQTLRFQESATGETWSNETGEVLYSSSNPSAMYDDVYDFRSRTFSPPIDARRQPVASMTNWSQEIEVQNVDPNGLSTLMPLGSTTMARVTVTVKHRGDVVATTSWLTVATE